MKRITTFLHRSRTSARRRLPGMLCTLLLAAAMPQAIAQVHLRVNYIPITDVTPMFLGIEKGYFAEEGIVIDPTPSVGGAAGIPGLMSGAYDIMYGNVVSTLLAAQQGFKLKIIAPSTKNDPDGPQSTAMVARTDEHIKTGKDLEGKTVGVNTRNNVIWLYARAWVKKTGGDPAKVTFKEVPFPQMADALHRKLVDAEFVVDPFTSAALAGGQGVVIGSPYSEVQPTVEVGQYVTTADYYAKNGELIDKFNRALSRSVKWFNDHKTDPETFKVISGFTKMKPELVSTLVLRSMPEKIDLTEYQKTLALMKENGLVEADIDIRSMIDPKQLK